MTKKMKQKNKKRCALSGRIINSNEEVIKTKYAEEYLKKRGYKVISPQMIALIMTITLMFVLIGGALVLSSPVYSADFPEYNIDENKVYIDDENAYISAEPHTLTKSGEVEFEINSKDYSGDINVIWGFNTSNTKPKSAELYNPTNETWNTSHTKTLNNVQEYIETSENCDYGNEYNDLHYEITYGNETNLTTDVYCFDSYSNDVDDYTLYWETKHWEIDEWKDISGELGKIEHNLNGKDTWYYAENVNINSGQTYRIKSQMNIKPGSNGKYDFAVYPSDYGLSEQGLNDAYNDGNLYLLDPWWNSTYDERYKINPNSSGYTGIGYLGVNITGLYATIGNDTATGDVYLYNDTTTGNWAIANDTTELCGYNTNTDEVSCPLLTGSADGLISKYGLDRSSGDVMDYVGNNDGTNNGATRGVTGQVGNAFDFEKDNKDEVDLNSPFDYNHISVNLWVYSETPDSSGYSNNEQIQNIIRDDSFIIFNDGRESDDSQMVALVSVGGTDYDIKTNKPNTEWEMWSFTYDGNELAFYRNGNLVGTNSSMSGDLDSSTSDVFLGNFEGNTDNRHWDGKIDDVRIYDRALSSTEVSNLYSSTSSNFPYLEGAETEGLDVVFNSQFPSDLTSFNLYDNNNRLNITYNITGMNKDENTIRLYHKTNSSDTDTTYYSNGTAFSGYFSRPYDNSYGDVYEWLVPEWKIYPITHNLEKDILTTTNHDYHEINNNEKGYIKTKMFNTSTNILDKYNYLEVMANVTTGTGSLGVWYCNNSYTDGTTPLNSPYCTHFYDLNASKPYDYFENKSSYHRIPFTYNQTTGQLDNVHISETSYFILQGAKNTNWRIYTIPQITRTDQVQTSTDGKTYSNYAGTTDLNLRLFNGYQYRYYACANDTSGNEYCSNERIETFEIEPLPPLAVNFYSPLDETYSGILLINHSVSLSPVGNEIQNYNISLVDENEQFVYHIADNNLNTNYYWDTNTSNSPDGSYKIRIETCDNESLCSYSYSPLFEIDNIEEPEDKSIFYIDLEKDYNVTILILLFISGVLMFFLYVPLSAIIFIILGFILLFSEMNILVSMLFIILGVYLVFVPERSET